MPKDIPNTVPNDQAQSQGAVENGDYTSKLQAEANPGPSRKPRVAADANAKPSDQVGKPAEAPENGSELAKITNESEFRGRVKELIQRAKGGEAVTFDVDTRVTMSGADGKPTKATQASMLYDELKSAYPDRAFVFAKPNLRPGDAGYTEIPAPVVVHHGGVQLSSKENQIKTAKAIALADGKTLPAGSKFAVGTTYDGSVLKSADPQGKVWAETPDGQMMEIAGIGKSMTISPDSISQDPKERGQNAAEGNHLIVRTVSGSDKNGKPLVDPDGKPLLDVYPNDAKGFQENYKPGSAPDLWAPKPKLADHLSLPANITIEAETQYGHATASGAKSDYFMTSGFADAKDATAKNYTGETDPRSAEELMRIRSEVGITGPTQVEAGLTRARQVADVEMPDIDVDKPGAPSKSTETPELERLNEAIKMMGDELPAEEQERVREAADRISRMPEEERRMASEEVERQSRDYERGEIDIESFERYKGRLFGIATLTAAGFYALSYWLNKDKK